MLTVLLPRHQPIRELCMSWSHTLCPTSLTWPFNMLCWNSSGVSGGMSHPLSLHGPAINLSLLQTPTFWYRLASLYVGHTDLCSIALPPQDPQPFFLPLSSITISHIHILLIFVSFLPPLPESKFHQGKGSFVVIAHWCTNACLIETYRINEWMAKFYSPMPGAAMRILETTTCVMACLAAFADSPRRFPFSSVTGMPTLSSLESKTRAKKFTGAFAEWLETVLKLWKPESLLNPKIHSSVIFGTNKSIFKTTNMLNPRVIDTQVK